MAKISLRVFKKGKPIFWIIGAIVVFVIFYMLFNKGGSASAGGGVSVVQSGPSEALQAAGLQANTAIQAAQIAAGVEAMRVQVQRDQAALGGQVALAQLASGERVALATLDADSAAAALNAQTNVLINQQNIGYNLESARVASETQIGLRQLDVGLLETQMENQTLMFMEQSRNLTMQGLIGAVGTLKAKDRDTALGALIASSHGQGFSGGAGDDYLHIQGPGVGTVNPGNAVISVSSLH